MDRKLKNVVVLAVAVPLLGYFCYDIHTQLFPSAPPNGNVPASIDSLPTLPQSSSTQPPQAARNSVPNSPNTAATSGTSGQTPKADPKQSTQEQSPPIVLASTSFKENPFVEMSILSQEHRAETASMLPAIPSKTPAPAVSNVPVPPPPSGIDIPTPPSGGGGAASSAVPVQTGTIETSSGARISLMSNGKVVTEESSDGIAYIGGGDVRMDGGKSIDDLINSIQVNRKQ